MTSIELSGAFDPLDLEIIERAYEAAWTKIEKYNPQRDTSKDPEYKQTLRRTLFLTAREGMSDPDTLCDEVLVKMMVEYERPQWVRTHPKSKVCV